MPIEKPTILLILDGWGHAAEGPGNAVSLAEARTLESLPQLHPAARLACSGRAVGLPDGFMGNSEVGHMNIGAGRVVYQDMTRIDMAIEDGSFFENPVLGKLAAEVRESGGALHLMGLVSDGGVHSHQNHIYALLEFARRENLERVHIHAFLDGRDTPPSSGKGYVAALTEKAAELGVGSVATVTGRYWAMDRDKRWERNELAYRALVHGEGERAASPVAAVQNGYDAGESDEFVKPRIVDPEGLIRDGDAVFMFNFRADRARQLVRALAEDDFAHFDRQMVPKLAGLATMTMYEAAFPVDVAFSPQSVTRTLGQTLSEQGLRQLRLAETEKYAHVTYFFNCGREEPFPGEDRKMVPSPREVDTYDQKPEMSAFEVTEQLLAHWREYALTVCNLANMDMVGHTGDIKAAVAAVRAVDSCVARIMEAVREAGGRLLVTADHGNSEEMIDASGGRQTAHSTNPVPFVLVDPGWEGGQLRDGGVLGDIAPTILDLMGLKQPAEMTGSTLIAGKSGGTT